MSANKKSLSRQVAEAVGYTVRLVPNGNEQGWRLYKNDIPLGELWQHESYAWLIPDFEHDATACIAALDETGANWNDDSHVISGRRRHMIMITGDYAVSANFCKAACKALLKWRKWKDTVSTTRTTGHDTTA